MEADKLAYVRNLSGEEFPLQATMTYDSELNGDRAISMTILPAKVNEPFIADIAELWTITDSEEVEYKVVYARRKGMGDKMDVEIKAIPLFFDDFDTSRIYEEYNQHLTAQAAFTLIFKGSGYNFILHDSHDSLDWEGFGAGETRLETFKRALERYGAEFEIVGNTIHIRLLVGRDTQFQYRYKLNASNIVQEIDATGFWTYAKGYGNYGDGDGGEDWQEAKLIREYQSPLANIPQIGIRHAPPVKNGNITDVNTMDATLKKVVNESLKVSVSADVHDLRKQGYALAQPERGDRVFLIDERIGLDMEVRVVAMQVKKDWRGNVTHFAITIGDEGVTKRYRSNLQTAVDNITNIIAGTQKLPSSVLDDMIVFNSHLISNARTELSFPKSGGILGIDPRNPNYVTSMTSRGFGVSTDGGATWGYAMTGQGINADFIAVGTLHGIRLIQESGGYKVDIHDGRVETYSGNTMTSSLDGGGHRFYRDNYSVGLIGTAPLANAPSRRGLNFMLSNDAYFMAWSHLENPGDSSHTIKLGWYKGGQNGYPKGFNFNDDVRVTYGSTLFVDELAPINSSKRLNFRETNWDGLAGVNLRLGDNGGRLFLGNTRVALFNGDSAHIEIGTDGTGNYVSSTDVYNRTYTATSQMMRVTVNGVFGRSTSSRRYKLLEEAIDLEYAKRILELNPKSWFDKRSAEDYAHTLSTDEETEHQRIERIGGFIAEDVHDAGLKMFVNYDKLNRPDGISSNLDILYLPLIKDLYSKVESLERLKGVL